MKDRKHIKIDKKKEMRTEEISKMISEGGLGADNYYNIKKEATEEATAHSEKDANNK